METSLMDDLFSDCDIISAYTRAQAIEDGVLIDVTNTAKEAGFKIHTVVTQGVWGECVEVPESLKGEQDEIGRLWDILNVLMFSIREGNADKDRINFQVNVKKPVGLRTVDLWAHVGPGDHGEAVLTIMLSTED